MNTPNVAQSAPRLLPIPEADRQDMKLYHASLHLTRQDVMWLDSLAAMYASNRSAVARLVLAEARRIDEKSVSRVSMEAEQ